MDKPRVAYSTRLNLFLRCTREVILYHLPRRCDGGGELLFTFQTSQAAQFSVTLRASQLSFLFHQLAPSLFPNA